MKIACVQLNIQWENRDENFGKTEKLIKEAKRAGAELVCLPELFSTGVTDKSQENAEGQEGQTSLFLSEQAKLNQIYLVGSYISKDNGLPKNVAAVYNPQGKLVALYEKIHVFTYNGEDKFYSAGNHLTTFPLGGFGVAPFICYDLRFPEIFRRAVDKKANVFIVIANWPNPRKDHWVTLLKARAIENQSYVVGVNRCGTSPKLSFFGNSMIVSPKGDVLAQAGENEEVLVGDISLDVLNDWRTSFTSLRDRRTGEYESF